MPKSSTRPKVPTLRDLALDRIGELAAELRKSTPSLSREQAISAVMKTAAGKEAYRFYAAPGGHLPWPESVQGIVKAELSKAAKAAESPRAIIDANPTTTTKAWREILAKRAVSKEGGAGGSGPREGMIEDPKTSGPKTPTDTLPAQPNGRKVTAPISPADAIYAGIRAAALRAAPAGTSEAHAIAAYLTTSEGQAAHARWNAARGR